ncbi:MAG: response regulator [Cytophagaceae bacterium]|nr:response regulator [Gemmatimonadaceae bacterium]
MFTSLRAKTVAALALVALVPSIILAIVSYRQSVTELTRTVSAALVAAAARSAAGVDAFIAGGLDDIRSQAQFPSILNYLLTPSEASRREAHQLLVTVSRSDPVNIAAYSLLDTTGKVLLTSAASSVDGERVTDPEILGAVSSLVPVLTSVRYREKDPRSASFFFASPVRAGNGITRGILMVEYEAAVLQRLLTAQSHVEGERQQGVLYDEHRIRLAGTIGPEALFRTFEPLADSLRRRLEQERRLRSDTAVSPLRRRIRFTRINDDSTYVYDLQQSAGGGREEAYVGAAAGLATRPWRVSVEVSRASVLGATLQRQVRDSLLLGLLFTLASVLSAVVIARRLTSPLLDLTDTARRFGDGDLSARVRTRSGDEIGRLGAAFNDLADRVGTLVAGLEQRTRELEEDMAKRERLQAELTQSRKMEAVGKLAGGIAHDFNNLLTIIWQNAELVREKGSSGETAEAMQDIIDASERGAALTRQLLTFAKRGTSAPRVVDVVDLVRASERMLRQLCGSLVELVVTLPDGPLAILIDPTQLEQVLLNVASNSRDAMPRGGTILVSAWEESPGDDGMGLCVVLEVADTGEGMSAETRARAFEPFYSTKEASRGTGLGLATVYGIVTQAGGEVTLNSTLGVGTTIRARFPRQDGAALSVAKKGSELRRVAAVVGTVLLVEDEPGVRHVVARALRRAGYLVHEAGNGVEGIALGRLYGDRVDVLVTDVVMPGADGFAVADTLTAEVPGLAVVLISGYSADARAQLRDASLAWRIVEKPFALDTLVSAVDAARNTAQAGR